MKRNGLRRMYPAITGPERFRLSLMTATNGDQRECLHLVQSCPRIEGAVADPSFTEPLMASYRVAWAFAQTASSHLAWMAALEAVEGVFTGETGRTLVRQEARMAVALVLDDMFADAAYRLRALSDAFEEVCRDRAGLSALTVMEFWVPHLGAQLRAAWALIDGLDPDAALRQSYRARLDRYWTLEAGGGTGEDGDALQGR
jgi:hypothetical protein